MFPIDFLWMVEDMTTIVVLLLTAMVSLGVPIPAAHSYAARFLLGIVERLGERLESTPGGF